MPVSSAGMPESRSPFCSTTIANSPSSVPAMRAAAAEDRGPAQHDGGDGHEFVAGPGVRFGLADMGYIDDGGGAGHQTRQHVDQAEAGAHGHAGIARALVVEAHGVERAPATVRCNSIQ